jgi:uncharacterized protein YcgL (UPF0745 family)
MKRIVTVFRSRRVADMYLYVDKEVGLERVPPDLMQRFGRAEVAMELELHPERRLARADAVAVLRGIEDAGFYLQLPPRLDRVMPT